MSGRRYDLDWLRIVGMGTVFLVHALCIFGAPLFRLRNDVFSPGAYAVTCSLLLWLMPTFFIISGMVTVFSLRGMNGAAFVRRRAVQLLLPFGVGVFVLLPFITYLSVLSTHAYTGTFWGFYLNGYFHGLEGFGGNFAWLGGYLWYLAYLFGFTVVVVVMMSVVPWRRLLRWLRDSIAWIRYPGAVFALCVPLVLAARVNELEPTILGQTATGGWNVIALFIFFCYGLLCALDGRVLEAVDRQWKPALLVSMVLVPVVAWVYYTGQVAGLDSWVKAGLTGVASWCLIVAIFGGFHAFFSRPSKRLPALNEAVLPFYVLHLPVVITVGFFVIQLNLGVLPKLLLVLGISLPIILILYLFVRRFRILRFLFGMRIRQKKPQQELMIEED